MKYFVVGFLDLFIGLGSFLQGSDFLFLVFPRFEQLYAPQPFSSYLYAWLMIGLGSVGIYLGVMQFKTKKHAHIFKAALIYLLMASLGLGFLTTNLMTYVSESTYIFRHPSSNTLDIE